MNIVMHKTMKKILFNVCLFYSIEPHLIFRETRKREYLDCRQVFTYFVKRYTNASYREISEFMKTYSMKFTNHATHINSIQKVSNRILTESKFRIEMDLLTIKINEDNLPNIVIRDVNLLSLCGKNLM